MQKIALVQMNPLLGALAGNAQLICKAAQDAFNQGAKLVVTPELSLTGYPPEDLLLRPAFIEAAEQQLHLLMTELAQYQGLTVVVGHPKKLLLVYKTMPPFYKTARSLRVMLNKNYPTMKYLMKYVTSYLAKRPVYLNAKVSVTA